MNNRVRYRAGRREKLLPGLLLIGVLLLDQLTKLLIVRGIEYSRNGAGEAAFEAFGGLLRIIHTRNLGAAFSLGRGLPETLRSGFFIVLPLLVIAGLLVYYWRTYELSPLQRWSLAAVLGGGLGNLIDRIFRSDGVVDFIDVRVFGLFGLERWPTFNVADAAVVVGGLLFLGLILVEDVRRHRRAKRRHTAETDETDGGAEQ